MSGLKDIRRRIGSVKNTQKITNAMKLVSSAKFARAGNAVTAARPYGDALDAMVEKLVASAEDTEIPLMQQREEKKVLLVIIGPDRGFCGGLNSNLFRHCLHFIKSRRDAGSEIEVAAWGKRPKQFCEKLRYKVVDFREKLCDRPDYGTSVELSDWLSKLYEDQEYDAIYLNFMKFESALSQKPSSLKLLPVTGSGAEGEAAENVANLIFEPSESELIKSLLKKKVASSLFRTLLEAAASEHGARMTAMDSATTNAGEVIKKLTLQYNRARQAAITKELIEITSGAEAL